MGVTNMKLRFTSTFLMGLLASLWLASGCKKDAPVNRAPVITSQAGTTAKENNAYRYDIVCTEPEGQAMTLRRGAGDTCAGMLTDQGGGTGTYAFTPDENRGGSQCDLEILCADSLLTVKERATVAIAEDNQAPVITNLPATGEATKGTPGSFDALATDSDVPANRLTWSIDSHTCSFTPTVTAGTGKVSWNCRGFGSCTAKVKVTDNGNPAASDIKTLTISCTNTPPEITSSPAANASEFSTFTYAITCSDANGDTLTLRKGQNDTCNGQLTDQGGGSGTYAFMPDETQGGGQCKIEVLCFDGRDADTQTSTLAIIETNSAPVIANLPAMVSTRKSQAGSHAANATSSDIPLDIMTWSLKNNTCSFNPMVNSATGLVSWTCGNAVETCTVAVEVTDNGVPPAGDSETLTIQCTNLAPQAVLSVFSPATESAQSVYTISCTDGDADALTLARGQGDTCGGQVTDNGNGAGTYSLTATESQGGALCTAQVTCADGFVTIDSTSMVTVLEDNQAPVITNLPTIQSLSWGRPGSFYATAADIDRPRNTLTWSLTGHSCSFMPLLGAATGELTWVCGYKETCNLDLKVTDNGQPARSDTKKLTITCTNQTPAITSEPETTVNEGATLDYAITCTDGDKDALILRKGTSDTCGGTVTNRGDGTGSYTFTPGETLGGSTCELEILCTDSRESATQKKTITVKEVNLAPAITNLPADRASNIGQAANFIPMASDQDLPVNSLAWSLAGHNCPFTPTVSGTTGEVTWTCQAPGSCAADVKVADNGEPALSDTRKLNITCTNKAPNLTLTGPGSAMEDVQTVYTLSCSDIDGDTLHLGKAASDSCGGKVTDNGNGSGTYAFTPGEERGGAPCNIVVTCADAALTVDQNSAVNILEDNKAPAISNLPDTKKVHWNQPGSFTGSATDADLPANSLLWSLGHHDCAFTPAVNNSTGEVSWQCAAAGKCSVEVTATDNGSPRKSDTKSLGIECTNSAPALSLTGDGSATEGVKETYSITCTDSDQDTLTLSRGGKDTCSGAVTDNGNGNGTYTFTPGEEQGGKPCTIEVACSDTQAAPTGTASVSVGEVNQRPYWKEAPFAVTVTTGAKQNVPVAMAHDDDLPNDAPGEPGYLTCSIVEDSCSFKLSISSLRGDGTTCGLSFNAAAPEGCLVKIKAVDGLGLERFGHFWLEIKAPPARIIFVKATAPGGGTGASWADALSSIRDALEAATAGTWIFVAEGLYLHRLTPTAPVLALKEGIQLFGGFAGTEASLAERHNPARHGSVLDGEGQSEHVVTGAKEARLDGFTITGGNAGGSGGGLNSDETVKNMVVANSRFHLNRANGTSQDQGGGAVSDQGEGNVYSNCSFTDNQAVGGRGGAILAASTQHQRGPLIVSSLFHNNRAGGSGGAISAAGVRVVLRASTFIGNHTAQKGGAFHNSQAGSLVVNSLFAGNRAELRGGALSTDDSGLALTVTNSTFSGNAAGTAGGAIDRQSGKAGLLNCILWGDTAGGSQNEFDGTGSNLTVLYSDVQGGVPGEGNIDSDPKFVHPPRFRDWTTGAGTASTLEVANASRYQLNEIIEIKGDQVARTVLAASGTTVSFSPALSFPSAATMSVEAWGAGAEELTENYRPAPDSPCRDQGSLDGAPSHDRSGDRRGACSGVDMGAYEYQGCPRYARSIIMDGQKDFGQDETFPTSSPAYTGYAAWDGDNLYLGMEGADINAGDPEKWLLVYISGDPGTTTGQLYGTQQPGLPFGAHYHLRWKSDGTYTNVQRFNGVAWAGDTWTGEVSRNGDYLELRIPLAALGWPSWIKVHMNMLNEKSGNEWSYGALPSTSFADSKNPGYGKFFEFRLAGETAPKGYAPMP